MDNEEKIISLLEEIRDGINKMNEETSKDLYKELREIKIRLMDVMK